MPSARRRKVADLPKDVKPRDVKRAAVIGAGTMGGGIAMCFANAGIPVTIVETSDEALKRGLDIVAKNYQASAKRGGMTSEDVDIRLGLMTRHDRHRRRSLDADMVIEAVFEDIGVKREVFGKLDADEQARTRFSPPTPPISTSTRSRISPIGRNRCWACISSARRT